MIELERRHPFRKKNFDLPISYSNLGNFVIVSLENCLVRAIKIKCEFICTARAKGNIFRKKIGLLELLFFNNCR